MHVWVWYNLRLFTDFNFCQSRLSKFSPEISSLVQNVRLQKGHLATSSSHATSLIISRTCCLVIFLRYITKLLSRILWHCWCGGTRNGAGQIWLANCCPQQVTCKTSDFVTLEVWGNIWYVDHERDRIWKRKRKSMFFWACGSHLLIWWAHLQIVLVHHICCNVLT